jgi:competence protein ComFC
MLKMGLNFMFPCRCLACGKVLAASARERYHLCPACRKKITFLSGRRCIKCSIPLISEERVCTRCREQEYFFRHNHSLCEYRGIVKELIYFYKFKARQNLGFLFAEILGAYLDTEKQGLPVIPVPSKPANIRKRGWDHMKNLVRILRRDYGVPVLDCLKRKGGASQKELDKKERFRNIRGKIHHTGGHGLETVERAVLLDDIFTTGATASECARVLIRGGLKEVSVVTLALDL